MASGQSQLDNSSILVSVRLLPTFAGVLREKKIRTRASFTKILANYISEESLLTEV